jgi:hypothetical protein
LPSAYEKYSFAPQVDIAHVANTSFTKNGTVVHPRHLLRSVVRHLEQLKFVQAEHAAPNISGKYAFPSGQNVLKF